MTSCALVFPAWKLPPVSGQPVTTRPDRRAVKVCLCRQNAILRDAFLAAEMGQALSAEHLWTAAEQEYAALDKLLQRRT